MEKNWGFYILAVNHRKTLLQDKGIDKSSVN